MSPRNLGSLILYNTARSKKLKQFGHLSRNVLDLSIGVICPSVEQASAKIASTRKSELIGISL
jgi:hypothetical protein